MNPDSPQSDWQKLVRRARGDTPPPIDTQALLRAVREAATRPHAAPGWIDDLIAVFGTPRALLACASLACAVALVSHYEMREVDDSLPWAELAAGLPGGEP